MNNNEGYPVPAIDRDQLLSRYQGYETILKQSIDIFFEEAPQEMEKLKASMVAENCESASKAAHSLLNKVGTLQGVRLMKLTRKIEDHLRASRIDDARVLLPEIEGAYIDFEEALKQMQSSL